MFERYTEGARRALFFARVEVSRRGGVALEPEHLLLGLLREPRGTVARLFDHTGLTADAVRDALAAGIVSATGVPISAEIRFSSAAKGALLAAVREADRLHDPFVGPEHLLVGLAADAQTGAGALLARHGLPHAVACARLERILQEGATPASTSAEFAADPGELDALCATFAASTVPGPPPGAPLRMYADLAHWWPLLSPPAHYVEEAADLLPSLLAACDGPARTLLELGSGGGSLAFHLKDHFRLTLTDVSPQMLAVNRAANPECEHLCGDMRTLDLGRTFDLVLVHDAVMYATDEAQLRATLATAARHLRPGGGLVVAPDCVAETFEATTECGGEDAPDGCGLRYLEWSWDPDRGDTTFEVAYSFLLREADGTVHADMDRHTEGLFPRAAWLAWLEDAGFAASVRMDPWNRDIFIGRSV
jgi:SAM-dependent methyltransferase